MEDMMTESKSPETTLEERIKEALDMIRPGLQADGGDMEYIGYEDGVVTVHLVGACGTCPMSMMTLKMGVENAVREMVPEVQEVVTI